MLELILGFLTDIDSYIGILAGWALLKQPETVADFYGFIAKKLESYKK